MSGTDPQDERLVREHRDRIVVHCYQFLGSFHEAEEAAQESLPPRLAQQGRLPRGLVDADLAPGDRDEGVPRSAADPQAPRRPL